MTKLFNPKFPIHFPRTFQGGEGEVKDLMRQNEELGKNLKKVREVVEDSESCLVLWNFDCRLIVDCIRVWSCIIVLLGMLRVWSHGLCPV